MDDFENDLEGDELLATLNIFQSCEDGEKLLTSEKLLSEPIPPLIVQNRTEFPAFPYEHPYKQQLDLMKVIYSTLVSGQCGVIESPTGTGKSLTLLTCCLHWLTDHNQATADQLRRLQTALASANEEASISSPDWVAAYSRKRERRIVLNNAIAPLELQKSALDRIEQLTQKTKETSMLKDNSRRNISGLYREYAKLFPEQNVTTETPFHEEVVDQLGDKFFLLESEEDNKSKYEDDSSEESRLVQIIYCSRTHSQLAQVMDELKRMPKMSEEISIATLASRQLLCVNKSIYSLKNPTLIREACRDLVGGKQPCRFRTKAKVQTLADYLIGARRSATEVACFLRKKQDEALGPSMDIEDASIAGCPYYSNRNALPLAQLVLTPYQTLVVPGAREASGLRLKGNVLIFDEAHNLLEAVAAAFSASITFVELSNVLKLVDAYMNYYRSRLSPHSLLRLRQLKQVVTGAIGMLKNVSQTEGLGGQRRLRLDSENKSDLGDRSCETVYTVPDWLFVAGIDHINLSYLVDYLRHGMCVQKIVGFGRWFPNRSQCKPEQPTKKNTLSLNACLESIKRTSSSELVRNAKKPHTEESENTSESLDFCVGQELSGSGLLALLSLLEALAQSEEDGRVLVKPVCLPTNACARNENSNDSDGLIRFIILNPGRYLYDAVREARSVLLVGGTMKPFDEFLEQIFTPAGKLSSQVTLFCCDHVINAQEQLLIYPLTKSPSGIQWDFTFKNRSQLPIMKACGDFLIDVCSMTPGGVAVFFPSFEYLSVVWSNWKSTGLLHRLQRTKRLFKEPRQPSLLPRIMESYNTAATSRQGACIVAVIGGKLSEGINFTDDLARSVVIIGLPYPNIHSVTLREKIKFLNENFTRANHRDTLQHKIPSYSSVPEGAGQRYCSTLCTRQVNQALGRAVRHARDYAVIFLLDERFMRPIVRRSLPDWAQSAVVLPATSNLIELRSQVTAFFDRNRALAR